MPPADWVMEMEMEMLHVSSHVLSSEFCWPEWRAVMPFDIGCSGSWSNATLVLQGQ